MFGKLPMKLMIYLGILLSVIITVAQGKTNTSYSADWKEELLHVFQSGSSRDLARYFDQGITININGNQGDYSKNQAELVMRDFFRKFPPVDFQLLHEGNNQEQMIYYIGIYKSEDVAFRVFIRGKKDNGQVKFYSIDIVKS